MDTLIRHTLATLAYRMSKIVRDAPDEFGAFNAGGGVRTPAQILAHMGDLMDWAKASVEGRKEWHDSTPLPWADEVKRFFSALEQLDKQIADQGLEAVKPGRLFQGAISDSFTHAGQLSLLRRLSGSPVKGENYFLADIVPGRLGLDQSPSVREFE